MDEGWEKKRKKMRKRKKEWSKTNWTCTRFFFASLFPLWLPAFPFIRFSYSFSTKNRRSFLMECIQFCVYVVSTGMKWSMAASCWLLTQNAYTKVTHCFVTTVERDITRREKIRCSSKARSRCWRTQATKLKRKGKQKSTWRNCEILYLLSLGNAVGNVLLRPLFPLLLLSPGIPFFCWNCPICKYMTEITTDICVLVLYIIMYNKYNKDILYVIAVVSLNKRLLLLIQC